MENVSVCESPNPRRQQVCQRRTREHSERALKELVHATKEIQCINPSEIVFNVSGLRLPLEHKGCQDHTKAVPLVSRTQHHERHKDIREQEAQANDNAIANG